MDFIAVSINHRTAPVALREELHLNNEEIKDLLRESKNNLFNEGFIFSTCNRTELYGFPANPRINFLDIQKFLLERKTATAVNKEHFQNFFACGAVAHLFRVSSGIDSMLIGDNQIFGQVKDAFGLAEDMGTTGFLSKKVIDAAIRVGKRARTETEISEGAITVSYAAVQLIEKIFSNLAKKTALVIGAGETGEIAAKHLRDKGIGRIAVTNRTIERAEKLAEKVHGRIIPYPIFKDYLHEYDIIVTATSSPTVIISYDEVLSIMKKRNYSPTIISDIAVPRDTDPKVREIDNVFYHDIDSLNIIVEQNLSRRKEEVPKVQEIIMEELLGIFNWYNSLEVVPTIKSLRDYFEEIRNEEVNKQINRFSEEDRDKVEVLTKRIINKILHQPTVELKKIGDSGINAQDTITKISLLKELFGLTQKPEESEIRESKKK